MKTTESHLQTACVTWFRLQYPKHKMRLFAIPNGGQRAIGTAVRLKAEGALAGVWDLFLAVPNLRPHGADLGGLFIEMKAPKGKLTDSQIHFASALEGDYEFKVCRSLEEFQTVIKDYLR
jgi:hypothetical protein